MGQVNDVVCSPCSWGVGDEEVGKGYIERRGVRKEKKKQEGAMTATCSQRKFLEAVKKFHCCPFSRVVFMSHIAFFILLFLFGETKDEAEPTRRGASAHNKREPPKMPKIKLPSLSHNQTLPLLQSPEIKA